MMRALILLSGLLAAVPVWGASNFNGAANFVVSGGASCSTSISDDFSGTLSKWTELGTSGLWSITAGTVEVIDPSVLLYTDEQTCTVTQWMMAKFITTAGNVYSGFYYRSENDETTYAYAVRYEKVTTEFVWRYCGGADNSNAAETCTTVDDGAAARWTRSLDDGDFVGVEVSGTGTGTEVKIYDLGTTAKQHANWAASSDASTTMTTDPQQAADAGKYLGLYSGGSIDMSYDDFTGGTP